MSCKDIDRTKYQKSHMPCLFLFAITYRRGCRVKKASRIGLGLSQGCVHFHLYRLFPRSAWECRPGRSASRRQCEVEVLHELMRGVTVCIPTQSMGTIKRPGDHLWDFPGKRCHHHFKSRLTGSANACRKRHINASQPTDS